MRGGENYMRIDPNAKMPEIPEGKVTNRSGSSTRSSPSSADHSTDQATLASEQRVQELQKQLAQTPEDRQGRVEALGRAIREGRYDVGAGQIAQSLFSEMVARSVLG